MVRIAEREYRTNAIYQANVGDATVSLEIYDAVSDEDMVALKNATLLEAFTDIGGAETLVGSYALVAWKSFEKTMRGYRFVWQTYQATEIDALRQENEDLTAALLELAAIVGGDNG